MVKLAGRTLAALGAALLTAIAAIGVARAEPAMWVVRDQDSTMYLFGTVHVLKPETKWRTPAIDAAFKEATEVWLEIDVLAAQNPAALQPFMALMIDPVTPLSKRIPEALHARVAAKAQELGMAPTQLEPLRTWLVGVTLAVGSMVKQGFDPNSGVDKVIATSLDGRGLRTLETLEQQFGFMSGLPEATQVALIEDTLQHLATPDYIDRLIGSWAAGDVGTLDALYLADMRTRFPEAYAVFLTKRNAAWAETLAKELAGAGTDFVAVGALHLVGPDSVPAMLKARGFTVEQVTGKK